MDCAYFGIRSAKPLRKASVATSKNDFDTHRIILNRYESPLSAPCSWCGRFLKFERCPSPSASLQERLRTPEFEAQLKREQDEVRALQAERKSSRSAVH